MQQLIIQQSAAILAIENNRPTALNPDVLAGTGIVPSSWQLAAQPIYSNELSRTTYTNGLSIIAESNRVMFVQETLEENSNNVSAAEIASKYAQIMQQSEYKALGLNFRGYVKFTSQDAARDYVSQYLLSPGAWQQVGAKPMRATLNLVYDIERCPLYLTINEASLRNPDETSTPIVLFSGAFSYELSGETNSDRVKELHQLLDNWQADMQAYQEIVTTKFFGQEPQQSSATSDDTARVAALV